MAITAAPYFVISDVAEALDLPTPRSSLSVEGDSRNGGLQEMLTTIERWVGPRLRSIDQPGARLDLGLRSSEDLLSGHPLHRYALWLSDSIKGVTGVQLRSVELTKRRAPSTVLSIAPAVPGRFPPQTASVTLTSRHSYATPSFAGAISETTEEIRDVARDGDPIRLEVSYVTGLPRTWSRLWEPTITGIFGPATRTLMRSGRSQIVELGFHHQSVGERFGHRVQVTISAAKVSN